VLRILFFIVEAAGLFIESVRAMPASVLTAIAALEQIFFRKNNVAFLGLVKIVRLELAW
jgi:hypothetical protein